MLFNFSLIVTFQKRFAQNIVFPSFGQFFPVLDGKNWEKQVYPSLSHFGRQKQVLDGKNPTLPPARVQNMIQGLFSWIISQSHISLV